MKKIAAVISILLFLCGCSTGYIQQNNGDAISPVIDAGDTYISSLMPLYFRYYTEPMLVRYSVNIDVTQQQLPEYYAVEALIKGVQGEKTELTGCFGKNTSLVSVSGGNDVLYVTLSEGFLTDTEGENESKTRENRKIALTSVVNTVTEMGSFSGVQFYLCNTVTNVSYRPKTYEMGLTDNSADSVVLGKISRNAELILTPSNAIKKGLRYYADTDWEKFYLYIGSTGKLPLAEKVADKMDYLSLSLSEFSADENYTVSENGKTATVLASFKVRSENAWYTVADVPLTAINKNGVWLMDYDTFIRYLGVEN